MTRHLPGYERWKTRQGPGLVSVVLVTEKFPCLQAHDNNQEE